MCTVGHSSCLHFEVQACTLIHASMQRLQNQGQNCLWRGLSHTCQNVLTVVTNRSSSRGPPGTLQPTCQIRIVGLSKKQEMSRMSMDVHSSKMISFNTQMTGPSSL